jgi:hypothetical protein
VPNHVNLIHPKHPSRGRTREPDARWVNFRAAFGSVSERRHQDLPAPNEHANAISLRRDGFPEAHLR